MHVFYIEEKMNFFGGVVVRSRMLESECLSLPISCVEILISHVRAAGDGL